MILRAVQGVGRGFQWLGCVIENYAVVRRSSKISRIMAVRGCMEYGGSPIHPFAVVSVIQKFGAR
jgi:hypothetical protein